MNYRTPEGCEAFAHFTTDNHIAEIMADGLIKRAESNLYPPTYFGREREWVAEQRVKHPELSDAEVWQSLLGSGNEDPDRLVWLTKDFYATKSRQWWAYDPAFDGYGRQNGFHLKVAYRIVVALPEGEAKFWRNWMHEQGGTNEDWMDSLAGATEAQRLTSKNWFVLDRVIPREEWLSVEEVKSGKFLWKKEGSQ